MEEVKIPLLSPEVQAYVFASLGFRDPEAGRDLLLSLARRVNYARSVHPEFGGMASVESEFSELKRACADFARRGDPRRMREEALDVMATCIRLCNLEMPVEEKPYVSGAVAGVVPG